MPVKRRIIDRPRRPSFGDATIALFTALDAVPPHRRTSEEFQARDRELAGLLGLEAELTCSIASVLDRGRPDSPERPAEHDRVRVYDVRLALLECVRRGRQAPGEARGEAFQEPYV
jgi:hypothetical protein